MDPSLIIVLAGAAAAGFAQGVSGFAFSLVALSIWAWAVEPQLAAPMSVFGALVGQLVALPWVWRGFDFRKLLPLVIGGLLGVPIGAYLLQWLDPVLFKFCLGVFLLIYCPVLLLLPADYKWPHGGRTADGVAGFTGGAMGGLAGIAGPGPTLWTTLRGWDKDTQRGVLQAFNITMHVATLTAYGFSGIITGDALTMFSWITPAVVIPAILGVLLFRRLNALAFRRLILGLLLVSGATLVWGGLAQWL
ncbi:sulfite exporter TauE/SafE family protein [Devosia sp. SL43]|uniref:sulfite exporter TauE/SafE family protein n=1 Tax=Devosia sp. SL43 TaxID=2806348 RepID=UPI001F1D5FAE|nr:sulfite exporter TauE/SafE family protein [Devosia sp. SL43]UJW85932.1 sulfite exporter TauE/SafE family protein [Devosia sp. SL43]